MTLKDDDLQHYESHGAPPLPASSKEGFVDHRGATIWYATFGSGPTVVLLHGGLGNSRDWSNQIPQLLEGGYSALTIDTRGHGRSSRGSEPFSYELFSSDVLAVLDVLHLQRVALVGWSDGACTSLVLARSSPERVRGVFFFACNVDTTGVKAFRNTPVIARWLHRHRIEYAELHGTDSGFDALMKDLDPMQKDQPNLSRQDLENICIPVTVAQAEHDEFIRTEHAHYLSRAIPGARLVELSRIGHFAPMQRPQTFNHSLLNFLRRLPD